jgi:hypothetical protein
MALTSNGVRRVDDMAVDSRPPLVLAADASADKAPTAAPPRDDVARVLASFDAVLRSDRAASSGSLWAALGGGRQMRWDEPIVTTVGSNSSAAAPAATTTRGLLEELLPGARPGGVGPSALPWLQRFTTSGEETI